jgi:hypothetical protein
VGGLPIIRVCPLCLSFSLPGYHDISILALPCMLYHVGLATGPKSTEPTNYGLKPPKLEPYKLIISGICYSNERPTNTHIVPSTWNPFSAPSCLRLTYFEIQLTPLLSRK